MLELQEITKTYVTKTMRQVAVNQISCSFRPHEFVAILGPSGSGKTTLLNIIGGLDHYDSGDLLINGRSTKEYRQRDWDNYRNHSVGFVFQSYNLIMHQSVLSNVELALTISGISGSERRERAIEALNRVGLGDHIHKKPQELSGGQMQRVAIARAIVNQPEIILADEPTGALDSKTSVQIMEILKEMADDHLVIMVTHNPELAKQYASRIITIQDGTIREDTDPYEETAEAVAPDDSKKASMSFLTALSLSFSNLITKKARTALVSFAGSIGIIGIALVLALASGVNNYINAQEAAIVSAYPLTINQTGVDLSALMSSNMSLFTGTGKKSKKKGIGVENQTSQLLSRVSNNDLRSFKGYLDDHQSDIRKYAQAVQYDYDITPQIYRENGKRVDQVNPNRLFKNFQNNQRMNMMMNSSMNADIFHELPAKQSLYASKYKLLGGHYPKNSHELLLVLNNKGKVSDLVMYALGMKNQDDLNRMLRQFSKGKNVKTKKDQHTYKARDFLGRHFKLVYNSDLYSYNKKSHLWINNGDNQKKLKKLVQRGKTLTVSGVVKVKSAQNVESLATGLSYPESLIQEIMHHADHAAAVKAQKQHKKTNILTNKPFGAQNDLDLKNLISVDPDSLKSMMKPSSFKMPADFSQNLLKNINLNDLSLSKASLKSLGITRNDLAKIAASIKINASRKNVNDLFNKLTKAFMKDRALKKSMNSLNDYLASDDAEKILREGLSATLSSADLNTYVNTVLKDYPAYVSRHKLDPARFSTNLPQYLGDAATQKLMAKENAKLMNTAQNKNNSKKAQETLKKLRDGYQRYASKKKALPLNDAFTNFLKTGKAQKIISDEAKKMVDTKSLENTISYLTAKAARQMQSQIQQMIGQIMNQVSRQMNEQIGTMMKQMNFGNMNPAELGKAIKMNMSASQMSALMESLTSGSSTTYESNLQAMGYGDEDNPTSIMIYPKNFSTKNKITAMITRYNNDEEKKGNTSRKITYTDMIGVLMGSLTKMVNTISLVLIAFVAISLIVSSLMIGVITYISVLERRKEIGVLRAIGASRFNVAEVFNAETFITGLMSGVMGILLAALLTLPVNKIIAKALNGADVKIVITLTSALGLIGLSVLLNVIAGLFPSLKAAQSDPVKALRSE